MPANGRWPRKRTEKQPTGPTGPGGEATWISTVIDMLPEAELSIVISEEARDGQDAELYEADRILLDLDAAEWLAAHLLEAIAAVKRERTE